MRNTLVNIRKTPALALLLVTVPLTGCERTAGVQPTAPQAQVNSGTQQNGIAAKENQDASSSEKNLTDPKKICQIALDARKKTIPFVTAFREKAPKGNWNWQDEGVNQAGINLADALSEEAAVYDGLVGAVDDERFLRETNTVVKLLHDFSYQLETLDSTQTIESKLSGYGSEKLFSGNLIYYCRSKDYLVKPL